MAIGTALLGAKQFRAAIEQTQLWLDRYVGTFGFDVDTSHLGSRTLIYSLLALKEFDRANKLSQEWLRSRPATKPEIEFSRALAEGEIAIGQQNIVLAHDAASRARAILEHYESTPADQSGVYSLLGTILLEKNDPVNARRALDKAKRLHDAAPETRQAYQMYWSDTLEERLSRANSAKPKPAGDGS